MPYQRCPSFAPLEFCDDGNMRSHSKKHFTYQKEMTFTREIIIKKTKMAADTTIIFAFTFFVTISSFHGINCSLYSKDDPMEILDNSTIKHKIYKSNRVWVVEFYSSWCGHCHAFAPTWRRFAKQIQGMFV